MAGVTLGSTRVLQLDGGGQQVQGQPSPSQATMRGCFSPPSLNFLIRKREPLHSWMTARPLRRPCSCLAELPGRRSAWQPRPFCHLGFNLPWPLAKPGEGSIYHFGCGPASPKGSG